MINYVLLISSIFFYILTYFISRNNKWSELHSYLPDKYLIKNKILLKYLFSPKNMIPIWLFALHIFNILMVFITLIFYLLYWLNVINLVSNKITLLIYFILEILVFLIIFIIHWSKLKKYTNNKKE